eukprot:TRINITY_DN2661_c0_g1_i3.p1 TRINITY_DN2661_c0_g1~~TRINITY_DN2661_c0_g1_i3.p1  ORF type:complete len:176 (+),score=12.41 TRINITY_DN2661_c0_g1_i3:908-1435(+)
MRRSLDHHQTETSTGRYRTRYNFPRPPHDVVCELQAAITQKKTFNIRAPATVSERTASNPRIRQHNREQGLYSAGPTNDQIAWKTVVQDSSVVCLLGRVCINRFGICQEVRGHRAKTPVRDSKVRDLGLATARELESCNQLQRLCSWASQAAHANLAAHSSPMRCSTTFFVLVAF